MRRRRSHVGRAIGVDAEPYRGRLVQDRGPRVGLVNHGGGRGARPRHLVRDSLVERRHSMIDGNRLTDMGKPGSAEWKRASQSHDYRRGFTAGVVVTASASSVLMLVGFLGMGGLDSVGNRLGGGNPADDYGVREAAPSTAPEPIDDEEFAAALRWDNHPRPKPPAPEDSDTDGETDGPKPKETEAQRQAREEDELAAENLGERDLGLDELVKTQQHNRKVMQRGTSLLRKIGGQGDE